MAVKYTDWKRRSCPPNHRANYSSTGRKVKKLQAKCTKCGNNNPTDAKLCNSGSQLSPACPRCGLYLVGEVLWSVWIEVGLSVGEGIFSMTMPLFCSNCNNSNPPKSQFCRSGVIKFCTEMGPSVVTQIQLVHYSVVSAARSWILQNRVPKLPKAGSIEESIFEDNFLQYSHQNLI